MSRPTSEPMLMGWGEGALAPAVPGDSAAQPHARHVWLDASACVTVLAPAGAAFDDEEAARSWARRAWLDLGGGDGGPAPEPVAWRGGRGRAAVIGVTWPVLDLAGLPAATVAPLWAGVLASAAGAMGPGEARLVVAEGRALTLIDVDAGVPVRWSTLALPRPDAAALSAALAGAPGPVWLAGHSLPGVRPDALRLVPALGDIAQPPAALLQAMHGVERAEPQLRRRPLLSARVAATLVGVALLVLAVAGTSAWGARQEWQAAKARFETREQLAQGQLRQRQGRAAGDKAAWQRLQQPWALRWAAAEAAAPARGGWLRLEQRRDAASMVLAGESDTPSEALALVRRIAAVPGVAEVRLLRSEAQGDGSRARFEIGVRLSGGAP